MRRRSILAGGALEDDEEITGINVTPFVDVMLVLLVIFMVTATYIVNQSITVQLPKAATGADSTQKNVAFVVDEQSRIFVDGQPVEWNGLDAVIKNKKLESDKGVQALISADEKTPHGSVVRLIDAIRKNGITDFAINVESVPE